MRKITSSHVLLGLFRASIPGIDASGSNKNSEAVMKLRSLMETVQEIKVSFSDQGGLLVIASFADRNLVTKRQLTGEWSKFR